MTLWKRDTVKSRLAAELRALRERSATSTLGETDLAHAKALEEVRRLEKDNFGTKAGIAATIALILLAAGVVASASVPAPKSTIELSAETTTGQFVVRENAGFALNLVADSIGLAGFVPTPAVHARRRSGWGAVPIGPAPWKLRERVRVEKFSLPAGSELAIDLSDAAITFSIRCAPSCERARLGISRISEEAQEPRGTSTGLDFLELNAAVDGAMFQVPFGTRFSKRTLHGFRVDSLLLSRPEHYADGMVERPDWVSGVKLGTIRIGGAGAKPLKLEAGQDLALSGSELRIRRIDVDTGTFRLSLAGTARTVSIHGRDVRPSLFEVLVEDPRTRALGVALTALLALPALVAAWRALRGRS